MCPHCSVGLSDIYLNISGLKAKRGGEMFLFDLILEGGPAGKPSRQTQLKIDNGKRLVDKVINFKRAIESEKNRNEQSLPSYPALKKKYATAKYELEMFKIDNASIFDNYLGTNLLYEKTFHKSARQLREQRVEAAVLKQKEKRPGFLKEFGGKIHNFMHQTVESVLLVLLEPERWLPIMEKKAA